MIYGFLLIALAYAIHQARYHVPRGRRVHPQETESAPKLDAYGVNEAKLTPYELAFLRRMERQVQISKAQEQAVGMSGGNVLPFKRQA